MSFTPDWRLESDPAYALDLMDSHLFAHLFTSHNGLRSSRIPMVTDSADGRPTRVRAHINAQNPQAQGLDAAPVLVAFSGPAAYVSPNWRVDKARGGTFDYEEVIVHGTAKVVEGQAKFMKLIDDLSSRIEPDLVQISGDPVWQTHDAQPGYIERLLPHITQFEIEINEIEIISKLHQQFPDEDRRAVADHLSRCPGDDAKAIAHKIRRTL